MTGLAVFNLLKGREASHKSGDAAQEGEAGGSESDGSKPNTPKLGAQAQQQAGQPTTVTDEAHHRGHEKNVGERYVARALRSKNKGTNYKVLKKEMVKRRKFLWLGGGDAKQNAVNILGPSTL